MMLQKNNSKKLFGTDGVRGIANVEPVTAETALKLGRAAAHVITQLSQQSQMPHANRPKIVVGKDTRLSGYMLEGALLAGITSLGVDVILIGPLPTPGVAYITRSLRCDAGIVLSASHNSYEDNGIKFFRHDGYKLDDPIENEIEEIVSSGRIDSIRPTASRIGKAKRIDDALGRYVEYAKASFPRGLTLEGIRVALDAGNGAAYKSSPFILQELGATVLPFHVEPNGTNINANCGSTHPEEIQRLVRQSGVDIGISHDGDADRVILTDETGEIVDGDEIMAIAATHWIQNNRLIQNTLVATIMSNAGLDITLQNAGGKLIRTHVGDRHVIAEMLKSDFNVGGEQSGHMIFRDYATTGDGIVSALQILSIMRQTNKPLSELKKCLTKFPQTQRNLKVREKKPLEELPSILRLVREVESSLGREGRVLLRYSGTETKIRLLIEGPDLDRIDKMADTIASEIITQIGA